MNTHIKKLGTLRIPDPEFGDCKLSVLPFDNTKYIKLPIGYELWQQTFDLIRSKVPYCKGANTHYLTIDSRFFTKPDFLRREGVHIDGNFCVDPNFKNSTWGGSSTTWGDSKYHPELKVVKDWVLPYDIEIPIGTYISEEKGGLLCVSTEVGCQGWQGEFFGEVGNEGDFSEMKDQLTDDKKVVFEKNILYFMTSNTPHETLIIDKGIRRTFMRITLNHEYNNRLLKCMQLELVS